MILVYRKLNPCFGEHMRVSIWEPRHPVIDKLLMYMYVYKFAMNTTYEQPWTLSLKLLLRAKSIYHAIVRRRWSLAAGITRIAVNSIVAWTHSGLSCSLGFSCGFQMVCCCISKVQESNFNVTNSYLFSIPTLPISSFSTLPTLSI